MDLTEYLSGLRDSLAAATRSSSDAVRQVADDLSQTLEPSLRLTLMELASDIAAQVSSELDGDIVEVRLRGGRPEIVVQRGPRMDDPAPAPPAPPASPAPPLPEDGDGSTARVSLRLPESLKDRVDDAAARDGVSVNTWLVRAAQSALVAPDAPAPPDAPTRTSRRMSGWAR